VSGVEVSPFSVDADERFADVVVASGAVSVSPAVLGHQGIAISKELQGHVGMMQR
jgi:hypothetical protein